ncbi:hypothetical protein BU26DRAFT_299843 [Trematosphaeria pertusa]|uniref:Uncharacterized protein n=1 Tax=Trematosphaeria pertusa TaxID=390896 RepID=A0A6A6IJS4_9PLEO|nr:uncharacterized protein BU26DRAFT_299843 [Trematosphaeria pertusa]KAF2250318.1 hypothetical protein BU26DRAFT_299843 [Trematosphaeria pertusa]
MATSQDLLSRLCPELRNLVYDEVLFYETNSSTINSKLASNRLALFSTSRSLHLETASYFFANGNFNVDIPSPATPGATILSPIADSYLRFLKHLTINIRVGDASRPEVQKTAEAITALADIGADFEEINLNIEAASYLSPLLNARFDDSILDMSHPVTASLRRILEFGACKIIRVRLDGAWFAAGVATKLQATFGPCIQFVSPDTGSPRDVSHFERELRGRRSTTPLRMFTHEDQFPNVDDLASPIYSGASFNSFIGIEEGLSAPFTADAEIESDDSLFDYEFDTAGTNEEELTSDDDDVDIDDDLLPIDEKEVEATAAAWGDSVKVLADDIASTADIEFMMHMAPEVLWEPERISYKS